MTLPRVHPYEEAGEFEMYLRTLTLLLGWVPQFRLLRRR